MTAPAVTLPRRPPRRALNELIITEAKCAWRAPVGKSSGLRRSCPQVDMPSGGYDCLAWRVKVTNRESLIRHRV